MQHTSSGKFRYVVLALLFFATTINYIDRQILSLLKPILDDELGWTNEQFGWVNSLFQGAYAAGLLLFGWFIDKFGTKLGYAVSIAAWSIAAMLHALAGSVRGFGLARVALGLGEGGNFPAAIKAVAHWFPKKERAFATTLFNSGANVGAILAPAVIPAVALSLGWKAAFILAGLVGFIWLIFWWIFYELPHKSKHLSTHELNYITADATEQDKQDAPRIAWGSLLKYPQAWSFIVSKFLTDPVWWFFLIWLPDYFKKTRGMDLKAMGPSLIAIYTIVTVLSIAGGYFTNYLASRGWSNTRTRKTSMFIFALLVTPILFVKGVGVWPAVVLIGIAGGAHQAWSANLFTTVSDMFPKYAVASLVGIGGMAGAIGGMLFPIFTGRLLDSFSDPTAGYAVLFTICASAYLLAFGISHLLAPRYERVQGV